MVSSPIVILISLLISFPLFFFLSPRFKSPVSQISSADELDDLSLFRRAAAATYYRRPISRLATTNPNPKIAFLFLTASPLHFSPLWEKFFVPNGNTLNTPELFNIYVHADPSAAVPDPGGVFSGRFIPAKKTSRSSPTLISATRRLLATAILDDPLNYYFTLLSPTCIPLHSFWYTYKTLFSKNNKVKTPPGLTQLFPSRLSYIEILSDEPLLWYRYIARGDKIMLPEIPFENFRVGSQFFTLAREHALTVIKDRKLWRKFKLPCLNLDSCYPEEHYFPTLLDMEDPNGCSKYTLTSVNWTGSVDGHPRMYGPDEVNPVLIKELRVSNSSSYSYLFARKFSPECLKPLMDLADGVIFRK